MADPDHRYDHQEAMLSETARASDGGPLRLLLVMLPILLIGAVVYLGLTGRLGPLTTSLVETANSWIGGATKQGGEANAAAGQSDSSQPDSGQIVMEALSPTELLTKYPPPPGLSLQPGTADQPAWQRFQRPFSGGTGARLGVLITGLGLNRAATAAAILYLPPEVSLSFSPYAPDLAAWIDAARAYGHEALVDLPMESAAWQDNPGPDGMMSGLKPTENLARLGRIADRAPHIVGMSTALGSRFLTDRAALAPVLGDLAERGFAFIETTPDTRLLGAEIGAALKQPRGKADAFLDGTEGRDRLDSELAALVTQVKQQKRILAVATSSPLTLAMIAAWSRGLQAQAVVLAPASALLEQ